MDLFSKNTSKATFQDIEINCSSDNSSVLASLTSQQQFPKSLHISCKSISRYQFFTVQSRSLECGMATGCVKILKKGSDFDPITGKFVPEEKRAATVELFKGERAPSTSYDLMLPSALNFNPLSRGAKQITSPLCVQGNLFL